MGRGLQKENVVVVLLWIRELRRGEPIRGAGAENMTLAFKGKLGIFFAHAHAMLFIILNSILPLPTLEIT